MNDNVFKALAHEPRRTLLLDLLESNPQDVDADSPAGGGPPSDAEQRLQIEMYHVHLPKLEDYGYIEWTEDTNDVSKGPRFEEIRPLLEFLASDSAEQSAQ